MPATRFRLSACLLLLVSSLSAYADGTCPELIPTLTPDKMMHMETMSPEQLQAILAATSHDITKPTTWSGCHTVDDTVTIHAPVTMAPGSTLRFKADAGLKIEGDGSLDAEGTTAQPITFTATDKTPGHWSGLYFDSHSTHNRLHYVSVLYAGGLRMGHNASVMHRAGGDNKPPSRAINVSDAALLDIDNSRVAYSGGYGMEVLGKLKSFSHNVIEHTLIPLRIDPDTAGKLDATNTFRDNDKNRVDLVGLKTINHDALWPNMGVPYYLPYFSTVAANLTLAPGTTIILGQDASLNIKEGSLHAVGAPDEPIVLRGENALPGFWLGLSIMTKSPNNVLRYVRISDGGGDGLNKADVFDGGYLTIEHCRVENSKHAGIIVNKNPGFGGEIVMSDITYKNNAVNFKEIH